MVGENQGSENRVGENNGSENDMVTIGLVRMRWSE